MTVSFNLLWRLALVETTIFSLRAGRTGEGFNLLWRLALVETTIFSLRAGRTGEGFNLLWRLALVETSIGDYKVVIEGSFNLLWRLALVETIDVLSWGVVFIVSISFGD